MSAKLKKKIAKKQAKKNSSTKKKSLIKQTVKSIAKVKRTAKTSKKTLINAKKPLAKKKITDMRVVTANTVKPIMPTTQHFAELPSRKLVGKVTHYFDKISVAIVKLEGTLKLGENIFIEGHGRSFTQKVISIQQEHEPLTVAKKGQIIGMKTVQPTKENDTLYIIG